MNKVTQKPQLLIQYKTLSKAQTDSFRHEMIMKTSQYLNNEMSSSKKDSNILSENSEEKSIFIKKGALQRTISVYQWRYKTCYPVVKPIRIAVKSFTGNLQQKKTLCRKNSQSPFQIWNLDQNIFELIVHTQRINYRLNQLASLPLPQLFYLLKQILVGFECLVDIFGLFQPTQQMVVVNEENEWRFWISEDFASNSKKQSNVTEPQFVLKIIKMVEQRLPNSKVGTKFFEDLKTLPVRSLTFLNLLDMTNIFISFNRIMVAKKYVSSNIKSLNSLHGSKNQIYFGANRTYNEIRETPKVFNDKTFSNIQAHPHLQQPYYAKQYTGISKLNTMKSLNERSFNKKELNIQNKNVPQIDPKKQKEIKSHMKISELYCAEALTKNNIEKRASFLFNSSENIKQYPNEENTKISEFVSYVQKLPASSRNTISQNIHSQNKGQTDKNMRPFSPVGMRQKQRKFSFQGSKDKVQKNTKSSNNQLAVTRNPVNQRKNSYYNYERPVNKQAFSQSPNKSLKNIFIDQKKEVTDTKRNSNVLMQRQPVNRSRKYSQHVVKIKSLDQFAKKNKKMCQSSLIQTKQQNRKVKYGNLKSKDIACHTRNATISGMAFGQNPGKKNDTGFNNINNDIYNGKFEQIMKSRKSKSIQGKDDQREDFDNDMSTLSIKLKRRATAFQMIRQCKQKKESVQAQVRKKLLTKPGVGVSNSNNQTAQTLTKSEFQLARGSQQSNSIGNNKVRESDSSDQKSPYLFANRRGMIGESNLSAFSCKTYQPGKEHKQPSTKEDRAKQMATSQDCFNKNESQSSGQFLKSNNWNKKISGLFNDAASIKILKESNHFGDQSDIFQKEYLKDVKLEKLDKLGKQLKCSIIQTDDEHQYINPPTRGTNNKPFSLIGQVKQEPFQNDPSYLEYSTSMVCQSLHQQERNNGMYQYAQMERNLKNCESFEQQLIQYEEPSATFNFQSELYKIANNH